MLRNWRFIVEVVSEKRVEGQKRKAMIGENRATAKCDRAKDSGLYRT